MLWPARSPSHVIPEWRAALIVAGVVLAVGTVAGLIGLGQAREEAAGSDPAHSQGGRTVAERTSRLTTERKAEPRPPREIEREIRIPAHALDRSLAS